MSAPTEGRPSGISRQGIVIKRTDPKSVSSPNRMSGVGMGMRSSVAPGTFQQMSNNGVSDIKGTRQKEKKDMQDLNERFAGYIDKVHFLEANCKRLEAENDGLRNRKQADFEPIRKAYENELAQARQVVDELTGTKGVTEAKMAGLQDEVDSLRDLIATYEKQAKDDQKKRDALEHQVGASDGEISTLRHRVGSLEDETVKLKEIIKKLQDSNKALRMDLDAETAAHIEADCCAQTKDEEAKFYKDLVDMFEMCKPEPVQIKGMDYNDFWKSEMKKALRDMNAAYDEKLETMQADMDTKYNSQMTVLKSGNVKDTMSLNRAKEEVSRLKSQLADKNAGFSEMATKLAALQAERDDLARQMGDLERELEELNLKYNQDVGDLQEELANVMRQFNTLMDAKMSLELEIACYKKLLEGEESRVGLKAAVGDALGATEKGNVQNFLEAALKDQSTLKESTGSLTVQRSSKGPIAFKSMDHSGGNIIIENTSSGNRARNQNLKNWRLVKQSGGRNTCDITLKEFELQSGKTFTVWARGAKEKATEDNEQVCDNFSFGVGSCVWKVLDEQNAEKATLTARFTS